MIDDAIFFPQAIFILLDEKKNIQHLSSAAESYVGNSITQLKGKPLADQLPNTHPIFENLNREGRFSLYDQRFKLLNSSIEVFDIHQYSENDRLNIFIYPKPNTIHSGLSEDARIAMRQASAMAAMLSHEIRNPLGAIKGAAQLLAMNAKPEDHELIRVIDEEAGRIGRLVNEFEDMADGPQDQKEPVNIHMILDRAIRAAKAGFAREIEIIENYDPSLPEIAANPDQFQRALSNLLKNASEAILEQDNPPKAGRITVQSRFQRGLKRDAVELPVVLTITDNGGGMKTDFLADAFKPFVTTKANGTGLGLAMVARVIEETGGLIEIQNIHQGCEVKMLLPIWRETWMAR